MTCAGVWLGPLDTGRRDVGGQSISEALPCDMKVEESGQW